MTSREEGSEEKMMSSKCLGSAESKAKEKRLVSMIYRKNNEGQDGQHEDQVNMEEEEALLMEVGPGGNKRYKLNYEKETEIHLEKEDQDEGTLTIIPTKEHRKCDEQPGEGGAVGEGEEWKAGEGENEKDYGKCKEHQEWPEEQDDMEQEELGKRGRTQRMD